MTDDESGDGAPDVTQWAPPEGQKPVRPVDVDQRELDRTVDQGLDSAADLRALTRILLWGLVAVVLVGAVAFGFGINLGTVLIVVGTYAVIAVSQWVAAFRRARERARYTTRAAP